MKVASAPPAPAERGSGWASVRTIARWLAHSVALRAILGATTGVVGAGLPPVNVFAAEVAPDARPAFPAGCERFSNAQHLRDVVITHGGKPSYAETNPAPKVDVHLVYPDDYVDNPFIDQPSDALRQGFASLSMLLANGGPFTWRARHYANGRPILPDDYPPYAQIMLFDRYPLERIIAIDANLVLSGRVSYDLPPLPLVPTEYDGLLEIIPKRKGELGNKRFFVARTAGELTDKFLCNIPGSVPLPYCEQWFDYRSAKLDIRYRLRDLPRWREAKRKVTDLLRCAYVADIPDDGSGH